MQEPRFDGSGFQWREWPITLRCFEVNDDHRTFLSWQHSDAALSIADKVFPHLAEDMIRPRPALLFQDSDDEPSRDVPASSSESPLAEARLGKTRAYYRCEGL